MKRWGAVSFLPALFREVGGSRQIRLRFNSKVQIYEVEKWQKRNTIQRKDKILQKFTRVR